jgi:two-component system cell cycle sensor histidine kinase/response regulator CckA
MPLPISTEVKGISDKRPRSLGGLLEWLLSPDHFHFKLFLGGGVGVLVITVLAVACMVITFGDQRRDKMRAHSIEVMRLSSVVENDVTALENAYRGHLLTRNGSYFENFSRLESLFSKHVEDLTNILPVSSLQRNQVLQMRENINNWFKMNSLQMFQQERIPTRPEEIKAALTASAMSEAHSLLQSIQREEQIDLNHRVREQEWAIQSTQILNFIPKMERAASGMQKENRGYLLTRDPLFIDAYKRAASDFYTFQGYLSVLVGNEPKQVAELDEIRSRLETWVTQCARPEIEAESRGQKNASISRTASSEMLMNNVRHAIDQFEKEQVAIYDARSAAAAQERILTVAGINLLCGLAAVLLIASSGYSFILYRRQLKKLDSADLRIRAVIDHVLDGMVTINTRGAILSMNPAARRMFGYTGNGFFGDTFARLIPKCFGRDLDEAAVDCDWPDLARRAGGTTLALARARHGNTFPVEISLTEMLIEQEKAYVAMIRDITERKDFEEELAAEKKSLAVTLASIGDGVITTDLHGRVLICNAASEAMTGWRVSEAVGKPLRTVLAISADAASKREQSAIAGYRSEAEAILLTTPERATLTSRDGTERIIEQVASPIRDAKNEVFGVVVVFRDITERQRDEAERRKAEALDQLGLLAGGIAHDFNNLLTAIIGNISLASMFLRPNDEMCERLEDAKNASLRARDLAQQLLTFARGGAPIKQAASIADLVQETVSFSLRGSQSRSDLQVQPDLWSAEFDPGQISQVVANLVVNAEQAMPNGGTLHVRCENYSHHPDASDDSIDLVPGDYICIRVEDDGVGIPPDCLKRIFDPYFTTKAKGNGLGLATVYSIVKNHSGLITVESELHVGTTFNIYLPAARTQVKIDEPLDLTNEPMNGSGRVLVVDDEEAIRLLVDFTLTRLGYEVFTAETAERGIEIYREALGRGRQFDLVILDLTLPGGIGGKEALKRLIEIDPLVNAVVSSGYAMDATMSRYEDFGFRGVIAKPYEASELGRKVHAFIEANRTTPFPAQIHSRAFQLQHAC